MGFLKKTWQYILLAAFAVKMWWRLRRIRSRKKDEEIARLRRMLILEKKRRNHEAAQNALANNLNQPFDERKRRIMREAEDCDK